mgnify:CR=1 FL=1
MLSLRVKKYLDDNGIKTACKNAETMMIKYGYVKDFLDIRETDTKCFLFDKSKILPYSIKNETIYVNSRKAPIMTLTQLHYVITIAETKSFNKAAEKLYVSQPSLTSAIKELEKELQVLKVQHQGSLLMITARGTRSEIIEKIQAKNPLFMEVLPLTLEEIFISETEVAGYEIKNLF